VAPRIFVIVALLGLTLPNRCFGLEPKDAKKQLFAITQRLQSDSAFPVDLDTIEVIVKHLLRTDTERHAYFGAPTATVGAVARRNYPFVTSWDLSYLMAGLGSQCVSCAKRGEWASATKSLLCIVDICSLTASLRAPGAVDVHEFGHIRVANGNELLTKASNPVAVGLDEMHRALKTIMGLSPSRVPCFRPADRLVLRVAQSMESDFDRERRISGRYSEAPTGKWWYESLQPTLLKDLPILRDQFVRAANCATTKAFTIKRKAPDKP